MAALTIRRGSWTSFHLFLLALMYKLRSISGAGNLTDCCTTPYSPVDCSLNEGVEYNGQELFCYSVDFYSNFECTSCEFTSAVSGVTCYSCCSARNECETHLAMWAMFTVVITSVCCMCAVMFVMTERKRMKKGLTFAEAYSLPKAIVVVKALRPGSFGLAGPEQKVYQGQVRRDSTSDEEGGGALGGKAAAGKRKKKVPVPEALPAQEHGVCVATPVGPNVIAHPATGAAVHREYDEGDDFAPRDAAGGVRGLLGSLSRRGGGGGGGRGGGGGGADGLSAPLVVEAEAAYDAGHPHREASPSSGGGGGGGGRRGSGAAAAGAGEGGRAAAAAAGAGGEGDYEPPGEAGAAAAAAARAEEGGEGPSLV